MSKLSIIIPTFNDHEAFLLTLKSVVSEIMLGDEIIVVDSSRDPSLAENIIAQLDVPNRVKLFWQKPRGVYSAQNFGITQSNGDWIQIVNSGDSYLKGARLEILEKIDKYPTAWVHVFSQSCSLNKTYVAEFIPSFESIWPHQSVVAHKQVHEKFGYYDEEHTFISDQLFLLKIRSQVEVALHKPVITDYDLSGISSTFSLNLCSEIRLLNDARGSAFFSSYLSAYLTPLLSHVLSKLFGRSNIIKLKLYLRGKL